VTDRDWMAQALALAALGEGTTRPNPLVGCVVVAEDAVIGRGFHRAAGEPHAESRALAEAGAGARGATLYVNLEPCAHHGRTAPCADAIVRAGIRRVVAAIGDPNPLVDGRGLLALRAAGISVTEGVLEPEARALNAPFLSTHQRHRPWVTLKAAQSLDGRIAASGGSSTWITGDASRRYAHRLRFRHDAVLVGAGTARSDDPRLTVRLPGIDAARRRVVLAPRLGLDPAARIFRREDASAPRTRVYVGAACTDAEMAPFRDVADIVPVPLGAEGLDLVAVLSDLRQAGVQGLLIEGGGKTSGSFLSRGLVDEIVLFIAGRLFGAGDATPVVDLPAATGAGKGWAVTRSALIPLGPDLVLVGRPGAP
jgi:diaminohydroxyphosphoribosylaminopyrimidine deaminase / 5-amino-6-(5-phosphoribosylamino)uracil reductase